MTYELRLIFKNGNEIQTVIDNYHIMDTFVCFEKEESKDYINWDTIHHLSIKEMKQ